jgi:hypothetical protein
MVVVVDTNDAADVRASFEDIHDAWGSAVSGTASTASSGDLSAVYWTQEHPPFLAISGIYCIDWQEFTHASLLEEKQSLLVKSQGKIYAGAATRPCPSPICMVLYS